MANNLTLGRGELWFSRFKPGTQDPEGERYFGNSPEFSATIESETLDHFDSDHGVNEKDESVPLSTNRSGSFVTDNIDLENVALFFFGSKTALTVAGGSAIETITGVLPGLTYQLGTSQTNPSGARGIMDTPAPVVSLTGSAVAATGTVTFSAAGTADDTVTIGAVAYKLVAVPAAANDVKIGATADETAANLVAAIMAASGAGTEYGTGTLVHPSVSAVDAGAVITLTAKIPGAAGNSIALATTSTAAAVSGAALSGGAGGAITPVTDYELNLVLGRLAIAEQGAVQSGDSLSVSYTTATTTRERVISGSNPISGALRYIAFNPVGAQLDWFMPYVKLTPNGDYALKGDEWQQIPFNVEILKKPGLEALYIDGRPYTPAP